ncbi:MAG: glycine/betaine ABC transporter substrate-binding protein [Synergistales bacterium]|nr:glycine/betaine ABC transporter substrate-binding protein [Synergistales bacterium]
MRKLLVLVLAATLLVGCFGGAAMADKKITVGAKNFTEQFILGHMLSIYLDHQGFDVTTKMGTGSFIARKALETGQSDIYPEYTGTAWTAFLNQEKVINDPDKLYKAVKEMDLEENGVVWFAKAPLNNTYALAVQQEDIETYGNSLSALAEYNNNHSGELIYGIDQEFYERPDGFFNMADVYNMEVEKDQVKLMEVGLTFESIARGQIDVAMVFATDGKIIKYNLQVLKDDKNFFPPYNLCLCAKEETLEKYPSLKELLPPLTELLDDETMQNLNYQVDVEGKPAKMVADLFLKEHGFIQ